MEIKDILLEEVEGESEDYQKGFLDGVEKLREILEDKAELSGLKLNKPEVDYNGRIRQSD
jgi:hypothetical protein